MQWYILMCRLGFARIGAGTDDDSQLSQALHTFETSCKILFSLLQ